MTSPRSGAFILSSSQYGNVDTSYWAAMARDLCHALQTHNERVKVINPLSQDMKEVLDAVKNGNGPPHYLITFNLMPKADTSRGSLWPQSKIPMIVICLDHPVHLVRELSEFVDGINANPSVPNHWIGVMEDGHRQFLEEFGWPKDRIFLCAQGGPPPAPLRIPYRNRKNREIIFTGTVAYPSTHAEFCRRQNFHDDHHMTMVGNAVERILDGNEDIYTVVQSALAQGNLPTKTLANLAAVIDRRARSLRRFRVLDQLKRFPVTIHGTAEDEVPGMLPHCSFLAGVDYEKVVGLYTTARIVVNDTINLRHAGLIRLFYPMAQGTVIASDVNQFLRDHFTPGKDFIPLENGRADVDEMVKNVLEDDTFAQEISDECLKNYENAHQWHHRVGELVRVISSIAD